MKKLFILLISLSFLGACDEINPPISVEVNRKVLIEEFTGVQCVQCPAGSEKIEELLEVHDGNLIAISIHAGFFSSPLNASTINFQTPEGTALNNYLGPATGYPTATVNRRVFPDESGRLISLPKWTGYIAQELAEPSSVNILMNSTYDEASREMNLQTDLAFVENVTEQVRLTILITENNIVNAQLTPETTNSNPDLEYKHKHVLRTTLTNFDGTQINETTNQGSSVTKNFTYTLPDDWNPDNCHAIAVVSTVDGDVLNVLQVEEVAIK